uniref:Uncharacterized protein MANES_18G052200 n=1 Tax=Rhizophora mucronata TaxID=61149 RepID=A0A2P2INU5_RHIMU
MNLVIEQTCIHKLINLLINVLICNPLFPLPIVYINKILYFLGFFLLCSLLITPIYFIISTPSSFILIFFRFNIFNLFFQFCLFPLTFDIRSCFFHSRKVFPTKS